MKLSLQQLHQYIVIIVNVELVGDSVSCPVSLHLSGYIFHAFCLLLKFNLLIRILHLYHHIRVGFFLEDFLLFSWA